MSASRLAARCDGAEPPGNIGPPKMPAGFVPLVSATSSGTVTSFRMPRRACRSRQATRRDLRRPTRRLALSAPELAARARQALGSGHPARRLTPSAPGPARWTRRVGRRRLAGRDVPQQSRTRCGRSPEPRRFARAGRRSQSDGRAPGTGLATACGARTYPGGLCTATAVVAPSADTVAPGTGAPRSSCTSPAIDPDGERRDAREHMGAALRSRTATTDREAPDRRPPPTR